jgi:hypothetical protein
MRYLTLISSQLDPSDAENAGWRLRPTPDRDDSPITFLYERTGPALDTALRIQEAFSRRQSFAPNQLRSLWMLETDDRAKAAKKLWPWVAAALSQNTTTSFAIVSDPKTCYGLAREYYREVEKDFPDWACSREIRLLAINTLNHAVEYSLITS